MPNDSILVETRVAYKDYGSIEESTQRIRDKFKLAGTALAEIGIYNYFVINKSNFALIKALTVPISKQDWENRVAGELSREVSYIDISDCIQLLENQILEKRRDPSNGFPPVAKLCKTKFDELHKVAKRLRDPRIRYRVPKEIRGFLCTALDIPDTLKRKIGV